MQMVFDFIWYHKIVEYYIKNMGIFLPLLLADSTENNVCIFNINNYIHIYKSGKNIIFCT